MIKKTIKLIYSVFRNIFRKNKVEAIPASKSLSDKVHSLEKAVKKAKEEACDEDLLQSMIENSFLEITDTYPVKDIEGDYIWIRYVKLATKVVKVPITTLLEFATESNYKALYKI